MRMKKVGFLGFLLAMLTACDSQTVYKEYTDISEGKWTIKNAPSFTFRIEDPAIPYNVYYNLRNSVSYPYYNLYLTRYLLDSSGKEVESRLDELLLMDPKTGKPLGDGLGDLFDHKIIMKRNYRFPKAGRYTIRIQQYMRQDPLPDVQSVGISVEKAVSTPTN